MELIIIDRKGNKFTSYYDECDEGLINKHKWHISGHKKQYVKTRIRDCNSKIKHLYLHRMLLGLSLKEQKCDHINRDSMDNRRCNLRVCTASQNVCNKTPTGISNFLGVSFVKNRKKCWRARIRSNNKEIGLGYYSTELEAALSYDNTAKLIHGEFANLNFKNE